MNLKLVDAYYKGDEYKQKLMSRAKLLQEMERSEFQRQRLIVEMFAPDPIAFIETFGFTKLTKYNNSTKPFFLFDFQKEVIFKLQKAENDLGDHTIVLDKPREMGATWLILYYAIWRWLFTPNWSGFMLSRTESEVDGGTRLPDKGLFDRMRWIIDSLPEYLIPKGYVAKGKKGTSTDMSLRLVNPQLQSSLSGSTTNANVGRSGRFSFIFLDEAFFVEHFMQIMNSLDSVSNMKVLASTSVPGKFLEKFVKLQAEKGDHIPLTVQMHPWKDDEWIKQKEHEAEINPEALRELYVSYSIPKDSQYYPNISQATLRPLQYDPTRPLYISMDTGKNDLTVIIWWQYVGNEFRAIEAYANKNRDIEWYSAFLDPSLTINPDKYLGFPGELLAKIKKWKKAVYVFSGLDIKAKKMPLNISTEEVLYRLTRIKVMVNNYAEGHEARHMALTRILPVTVFNEESEGVMELYDAIANSRYGNAVNATSKMSILKPVHDDRISDYRSAAEYFATNISRTLRLQRTEDRSENFKSLTGALTRYLKV